MTNEEVDRLEWMASRIPRYLEIRKQMLQEVETYPSPNDWIYQIAQGVVTDVQRNIPSGCRTDANSAIEAACEAAEWDSQYYKICIAILYRLQMGLPINIEHVMICHAIYKRNRKYRRDIQEHCRRLGIPHANWLNAVTCLLGLEENSGAGETLQSRCIDVDIPTGQPCSLNLRINIRPETEEGSC